MQPTPEQQQIILHRDGHAIVGAVAGSGKSALIGRIAHLLDQGVPASRILVLIGCAANLALQGGVKSADGKAVLAFDFSAESAAVRCTVG